MNPSRPYGTRVRNISLPSAEALGYFHAVPPGPLYCFGRTVGTVLIKRWARSQPAVLSFL